MISPPPAFGDAATLAKGAETYQDFCTMCHDTQFGNRGLFPDLRNSPMLKSARGLQRGGASAARCEPRGMVSFRERFSAEDAEAVRAYITQRAHEALPR